MKSPNHAWLSLDLLEILCRLAELGHADQVRELLEFPRNHCPELLAVGLVQVNTDVSLKVSLLYLKTYFILCLFFVDFSLNVSTFSYDPTLRIKGRNDWRKSSLSLDICMKQACSHYQVILLVFQRLKIFCWMFFVQGSSGSFQQESLSSVLRPYFPQVHYNDEDEIVPPLWSKLLSLNPKVLTMEMINYLSSKDPSAYDQVLQVCRGLKVLIRI